MSMRGMILLERYELEELIGTGGMAIVYRARDVNTGATVAIKMLKQEYNSDIEFVRRFQREAIAAQTMLHPNIIKVMDVGEQNNIKFIVMEFVDGVTIKDMVERGGAIPVSRAVDYAIQISRALEHAHRCHIVHRDIKSQNIMVDKRGIIKVADFGIARATNSSTVTASDDGILGSVHYFSPEQAKGEVADEKSDIYSLGIVIYEMVTGRLPFDGDVPVAIALKHIQEAPQPPRSLNSDIPPALNDVILKALRKKSDNRYRSAIAMELDLSMVLTHPEGGYVVLKDDDLPSANSPNDNTPQQRDDPLPAHVSGRRKKPKLSGGEDDTGDSQEFEDEYDTYLRARRKRRIAVLTALTAVAIVLVVMASFSLWRNVISKSALDDLTGMKMEQAVEYLAEQGLDNGLIDVFSNDAARGTVVSQFMSGKRVILEISKGPESVQAADLSGKTVEEADEMLYEQGLSVGEVIQSHTAEGYAEGEIFMQSPEAGVTAKNGDKVIVYVFRPLQEEDVPKVVGLTLESAHIALKAMGFALGNVEYAEYSDVPEGLVVSQSPDFGDIAMEGTPVDVVVSSKLPVYESQKIEFQVTIPSGGATVIVYRNVGADSKEMLREELPAGEKNYTVELESQTGESEELIVYVNNTRVHSIQVDFTEAGQ
ncbi:MAG: Stk1 family PASTA domain-containing Ser/Thr kinase [Christensenellales bacterium]|jgi:serine/threonine protein kinase/beta-lactam-binding protein with PASTA domain